jgi:hypothetical protein
MASGFEHETFRLVEQRLMAGRVNSKHWDELAHKSYECCPGAERGEPLAVKQNTNSSIHIIQSTSYCKNIKNMDRIVMLRVVFREVAGSNASTVALHVLQSL